MEERLQKIIARAGVCSRRDAEKLIVDGRVSVNGHVVKELGHKADPEFDTIAVDTVPLEKERMSTDTRATYLLLNKPKGVLCTVRDDRGRKTVLDLVPPYPGKRLYPVGRLDEDSVGLVLLTDDGELTDQLTHPRYGVPKTYDVRVKGKLTPDDARRFESGVWLSDGRTGASRVRIRKAGPKVSHVHVTLTEGRNREIRRVFAKLGFSVLSLRRVRIGPVEGRGLKVGQYRPLHGEEVAALRDCVSDPDRRFGQRTPRAKTTGTQRRGGKPDPARRGRGGSRSSGNQKRGGGGRGRNPRGGSRR